MELSDVDKTIKSRRKRKFRKPYVAPRLERLSPLAAKNLLSRHDDASGGDAQQMIECIHQLHGAKGS